MYAMAQIQIQDTIQGTSLLLVQAAMHALEASGKKPQGPGVRVLNGARPAVVFLAPDGSPETGIRATGPPLPMDELRSLLTKEKITDNLRSSSLSPLLAAAVVFQKRKLDLKLYTLELVRQGGSYVVIFKDKDAQEGGLGNPGKRPGFEVELDAADLRVIRANFIR